MASLRQGGDYRFHILYISKQVIIPCFVYLYSASRKDRKNRKIPMNQIVSVDSQYSLKASPRTAATGSRDAGVTLSIVATLYKSQDYIDEFYKRATIEARKITSDYEILFVDDGSPDESLLKALNLVKQDRHVRIIELARNFGHHKAMMTGIEHARGQLVFLIDVDLEEPPELLFEFHKKMAEGDWDVVYGTQEARKGGLFEKSSGAIAWWLVKMLLPTKVPQNHSTVRLMKADYARALALHKEHKTAIGGLWVETGFKQTGIQFKKLSRNGSSYLLTTRLTAMLDSITSFSERPLYFVFFLGVAILALSSFMSLGLFVMWCSGKMLPGWVSVMTSVWFLGGLAIFCIGVVGLYTSRIFVETKMRPYTIIRHIHLQDE